MYIKLLRIRDFKSIKGLEVHLDKQFSILTGVNNSGKTTILMYPQWHAMVKFIER
jgi:predicted ATP-dependent endonuclease of OLD family